MAILLVTDYGKDPAVWQRALHERVADIELRGWPDIGAAADIEAILSDTPLARFGGIGQYENLEWIHFLGHGVGDLLSDPGLPVDVPVTREKRESVGVGLAIYALQAVTAHHLRTHEYRCLQAKAEWTRLPVTSPSALTILVLGLGVIGQTIAARFKDLGYNVVAWSRTGKSSVDVRTAAGPEALMALWSQCDYVIGALPETDRTRHLIDDRVLALMKPSAYIINLGRGSLINESHLLSALDEGAIAGAALDVFENEPLPKEHPFWQHEKVTITPHAGGPSLDDEETVFDGIAENYRRLKGGQPLLNRVDRAVGY